MQFISWNVNGLRACVKKGFMDFFNEIDSDFFCLQEIKLQEGQIELELPGYQKYWNYAERKGYSGTAIFTKHEPLTVTSGLGKEEHDQEGRLLTLEYQSFYLVNVYTPNSQRGLGRLDYRMAWDDDFRLYLTGLSEQKDVIVCGDLNVAHQEIDLKNPQTNRKNAGFTDQERARFTELLDAGFIDTFRHLYPEQEEAYTWWSYFANSRARNIGWRIDYFLISQGLRAQLVDAEIYAHILGSDHCPVGLKIELT